jgi:transposase-like protein
MQQTVKTDLREIWQAAARTAAQTAMDTFAEKYGAKYEKAVTCLTKDREAMLAFYDFPAEHWDHLRTGNPIESVFATVRHRTVRSKGANQLPLVIEGVTFTDGVAASDTANRAA